MVVPRGHPRIVVRNDADLPQGGRGSSAQVDMNFLRMRVENGRTCAIAIQGSRKTSQGSFELSL